MKWEKGIVKSDISLKEALAQVGVFKTKIDSMNLVIAKIQKKLPILFSKKNYLILKKRNTELSIATSKHKNPLGILFPQMLCLLKMLKKPSMKIKLGE